MAYKQRNYGFLASLGADVENATGNATPYTLICDNIEYEYGGGYDNTTGIYTVNDTGGIYQITVSICLADLLVTNTVLSTYIYDSLGAIDLCPLGYFNPSTIIESGDLYIVQSTTLQLQSQQISVVIQGSGNVSDNITIVGSNSSLPRRTYISINQISS